MLPARSALALIALLLLPGCGLIHFGRLPAGATSTGDAGMAEAYTSLATEHKMLKQELAIVRREGDALRASVDRAGGASPGADLVAQLNATTRELATLRATHARLQSEPPAASSRSGSNPLLAAVEEKLAVSLRNFTQLQEENARLRAEVQQARTENTTLAGQLSTAVTRQEQARAELGQLNNELLAQKEARARADQAANAARAQLSAVLAAGGSPTSTSVDPGAAAPATLRLAKAPPADASATAELRTDAEKLRLAGGGTPVAPATAPRTHVVAAGDTLERLAQKYYNAPDRWRQIYDANEKQLGNGRPLTVGMHLEIPEK